MEESLDSLLQLLAVQADHLRSALLRATMTYSPLRMIYCHRASRLATLFLVTCVLMLWVSLHFPLWVLALGPAVYGVPHVFASLRYFDYSLNRKSEIGQKVHFSPQSVWLFLGATTAVIALYRWGVTLNWLGLPVAALSEWRGSTYLELLGLTVVFVGGAYIYRIGFKKAVVRSLWIIPLMIGFAYQPGWTVGALVLLHNFVAFAYWSKATQTPAERWVARTGGIGVFLITLALFAGVFDELATPGVSLAFAGLDFAGLGATITPWSENPQLWRHAAEAYAFGQAMHYFVWLKAIPDQYHRSEAPTSFRQSLASLERDFGKRGAMGILIFCVVSAGLWLGLQFPRARALYFCIAGFHGYLEIAGLFLAASSLPAAKADMRAIEP